VDHAVEAVRPLLEARRHRLTTRLPPEPVTLVADSARLLQILENLLGNAAKYTPDGGSIELVAERADSWVVLRVRDNGIGIAPDLLPQVFEPFVQADQSLDRSAGGLGIGLTLVRRLVELHGGTVEAFSEGSGRGSEFRVCLPVAGPGIPADSAPADPGG
jgi:signal transduction histidine kinase